jgi:hypothetical protein
MLSSLHELKSQRASPTYTATSDVGDEVQPNLYFTRT